MHEKATQKVVTRFAPSPTGFLHVGGVRTAIYAWLWARRNNGKFILRIEDTDKEREVEGSIKHIQESLKWVGVDWDEFKIQSHDLSIYKKYAQKLIDEGFAYADPYSKEELEEFRKKAEQEKRPFLFRDYRPEKEEVWDGTKPLRFKVKDIKRYEWKDEVLGDLSAGPEALDDFILIKSDGYPTYNFAHIVDDIEMGVTHVMRGHEFVASTPKYLSLYNTLGVKSPHFVTLPPIMGPDGKKKLSKRDGAKDILDYKTEGYLPETLFNFLALLGWNPGDDREVMSTKEMVEVFDIRKIQKSGAQFNEDKLNWISREHIKLLSKEEVEKNILAWLPESMRNPKLVPVIFDRISKWGDVKNMADTGELDLFFKSPNYDKEKIVFKNSSMDIATRNIKSSIEALEKIEEKDFTLEKIKDVLMKLSDETGKRGELLHPVRFALSGLDKSPDPFIIAEVLGKNETISRLQKAIA